MYLAKFFHRAPGDDDKELLFIPGDEPIVMGIHMHGDDKIGEDEFFREEFSDIRAAVTIEGDAIDIELASGGLDAVVEGVRR